MCCFGSYVFAPFDFASLYEGRLVETLNPEREGRMFCSFAYEKKNHDPMIDSDDGQARKKFAGRIQNKIRPAGFGNVFSAGRRDSRNNYQANFSK